MGTSVINSPLSPLSVFWPDNPFTIDNHWYCASDIAVKGKNKHLMLRLILVRESNQLPFQIVHKSRVICFFEYNDGQLLSEKISNRRSVLKFNEVKKSGNGKFSIIKIAKFINI